MVNLPQKPALVHTLAIVLGGGACLGAFTFEPPTASRASTILPAAASGPHAPADPSAEALATTSAAFSPLSTPANDNPPDVVPPAPTEPEESFAQPGSVALGPEASSEALDAQPAAQDPRQAIAQTLVETGYTPAPDADAGTLPPIDPAWNASEPTTSVRPSEAEAPQAVAPDPGDEPLIIID